MFYPRPIVYFMCRTNEPRNAVAGDFVCQCAARAAEKTECMLLQRAERVPGAPIQCAVHSAVHTVHAQDYESWS